MVMPFGKPSTKPLKWHSLKTWEHAPFFIFGAPATVEAGAILARIGTTEKNVCEKKLKKVEKNFPKPLDKSGNIVYTNYRKKEREVKKNVNQSSRQ